MSRSAEETLVDAVDVALTSIPHEWTGAFGQFCKVCRYNRWDVVFTTMSVEGLKPCPGPTKS
jgi:hypothetical protein